MKIDEYMNKNHSVFCFFFFALTRGTQEPGAILENNDKIPTVTNIFIVKQI
jgi:hypothetical protein